MKKIFISLSFLWCLLAGIGLCLTPAAAFATAANGTCTTSMSSGAGSDCDNCISGAIYQNLASGDQIINAMFTTINSVLTNVESSFFNAIIGATSFQQMIGTAMLLYVVFYGLMITFNLSAYNTNEIATRLMKVAFVYMMTGPNAFQAFQTWIQTPVIGGMNQIIQSFTQTAEGGGSSITTLGSGTLDPIAFTNLFGSSMTTVVSLQLLVAIIGMLTTGFFGWLIAIFLAWALVQFLLMMIGALVTYAKAIIGLAFLFGIAPLFFILLLFERSRPIFAQWVNMVVTFALQPILLFAFLSFYVGLITYSAPFLLKDPSSNPTDFCWLKGYSIPGSLWDMSLWHPTYKGAEVTQSYTDQAGNQLQEPINVPNALYFLLLCHLGRMFTKFIGKISEDLGQGIGLGVVQGTDISRGIGALGRKITGKK